MNRETFLDSFGHIADAPGGIDRLRRLILDLAVSGSLVDQDLHEEPADAVLVRIAEARARLVAQKKLRPPARHREIPEQSEPFGLPINWSWARLSDVLLKLTDGTHHSPPNGTSGDYPYVSAKHVKDGYMALDDLTFVSAEHHEEIWARCDPRPGDVLFVKDGATTGNAALVELSEPFSMLSSVAQLRPGPGLDGRYLLLAMRSPVVRSELRGGMKGSAITRTTLTKLGRVLFPLPPASEQLRIVQRVDELMALCDELENQQAARVEVRSALTAATVHRVADADTADDLRTAISSFAERIDLHLTPGDGDTAALKRLRQTILDLAVRGRLTRQDPDAEPAGDLLSRIASQRELDGGPGRRRRTHVLPQVVSAEPFGIPDSWAWASLGSVCQSRLGKMLDAHKNTGPMRPYLRNTNVQWERFQLEDIKELRLEDAELGEYAVQDGDLLVVEGGEPGRCAIWDASLFDGVMVFQKALHRVRPEGGISARFIALALRNGIDSGRLQELFTGSTIKHLTGEKLKAFLVPLPPIEEQHRIVHRVAELSDLCDQLEQQFLAATTARGDLAASIAAHA